MARNALRNITIPESNAGNDKQQIIESDTSKRKG